MSDQAQVLRGMMVNREAVFPEPEEHARRSLSRTITVTSGKGGVGKSNLALNLAIALAEANHSVCLLDANLGLGNIDLLCGLNGYWNLSHVISGARTLEEIQLIGPAGLHVIPGASGLTDVADCAPLAQQELLDQLDQLETEHEFLLIDTGSGIHRSVRQFVAAADLAMVVTTPEPTALADAYATIKALSVANIVSRLELLVNRADSAEQARDIIDRLQRTARSFLQTEVGAAGWVPDDPAVVKAVRSRVPFLVDAPDSPASQAVVQLARRISQSSTTHSAYTSSTGFFRRLWTSMAQVIH